MIAKILPIDPVLAATHGFQRPGSFSFASQQPAVAIHISEVGALAATLPLAFAKLSQEKFLLVAVTGFADGRNQLVDDNGCWGGLYLPHQLRAYPFSLQAVPAPKEGEPTLTVSFDHGSGLYRAAPELEAGDVRFFDDEGQPQPMFKQISDLLTKNAVHQQHTQRAVDALHAANLLTPWQIKPDDSQSEQVLAPGFYRVDESRLKQLQGPALEVLHQVHALGLAYGQLLSMSRVVVLKRLKAAHDAAKARPISPKVDPSIVQQLFDPVHGDTVKFNW